MDSDVGTWLRMLQYRAVTETFKEARPEANIVFMYLLRFPSVMFLICYRRPGALFIKLGVLQFKFKFQSKNILINEASNFFFCFS